MNKLTTNVLMLGKSGVGKSSLINYLFGREVQETGTGKPVTKKGIFKTEFPYDENFIINIYDTWGIEADKPDEWKKEVFGKISEFDNHTVDDWFSTVFYCISATSGRLEDFDLTNIVSLLREKNHVVVVLTRSKDKEDNNAATIKNALIKEMQRQDLQISQEDIIPVCNVNQKLIGSNVTQFGKEAVIQSIIRTLWDTFKEKVPYVLSQRIKNDFSKERKELLELVDKYHFALKKEQDLECFQDEVNERFSCFITNVANDINMQFKNAFDYYYALTKRYMDISTSNDAQLIKASADFEALKGFKEEISKSISELSGKLERLFGQKINNKQLMESLKKVFFEIRKFLATASEVKKEIKSDINNYMGEAEKYMLQQIKKTEDSIKEIRVG